jgi:uncharacterized protein (TIGR03437 family)
LAPLGTLQAGLCWSGISAPTTVSYEIDGLDSAGNKIVTTAQIPFNPAPAQNGGALSSSANSITLTAAPGQTTTASVPVTINADQSWSAVLFPANQQTSWLVAYPLSGTGPGTVNLVASAAGLSPGVYTATLVLQSVNTVPQFVNVPVTFTIGGSSNISITAVTNGASFQPGSAPGMIAAVFGKNLANSTQSAPSFPLPKTLVGVSASVNGEPAPLYFVSPGQINLQIPYETPTGSAILAINNNGQVATFKFTVASTAPGVFNASGSVVPISTVSRGQGVAFYITGDGDVLPYVDTGAPPAGAAIAQPPMPRQAFTMTLGGVPIKPAFVGVPSWSVGVTQINFIVPDTVPPGVQPLAVKVGSFTSAAVNLRVVGASGNVQFVFNPPSVNRSSDNAWHYSTTLRETGGVGVNLTKLVVFGNDYTSNIQAWFGGARLSANGSLSGNFNATCSCSPPWDGVWQITGTDDNGNTNTWSGVVHFLPPATAAEPSRAVPASASSTDSHDAAADPSRRFPAAAPDPETSRFFGFLREAGVIPSEPVNDARLEADTGERIH